MTVCSVASQRGWTIPGVNTTNATGRALFKRSILTTVKRSVDYCTTGFMAGAARCQGMLVWSLEGQQYPQDISYIGSPDMLPELAPEMDAIADESERQPSRPTDHAMLHRLILSTVGQCSKSSRTRGSSAA